MTILGPTLPLSQADIQAARPQSSTGTSFAFGKLVEDLAQGDARADDPADATGLTDGTALDDEEKAAPTSGSEEGIEADPDKPGASVAHGRAALDGNGRAPVSAEAEDPPSTHSDRVRAQTDSSIADDGIGDRAVVGRGRSSDVGVLALDPSMTPQRQASVASSSGAASADRLVQSFVTNRASHQPGLVGASAGSEGNSKSARSDTVVGPSGAQHSASALSGRQDSNLMSRIGLPDGPGSVTADLGRFQSPSDRADAAQTPASKNGAAFGTSSSLQNSLAENAAAADTAEEYLRRGSKGRGILETGTSHGSGAALRPVGSVAEGHGPALDPTGFRVSAQGGGHDGVRLSANDRTVGGSSLRSDLSEALIAGGAPTRDRNGLPVTSGEDISTASPAFATRNAALAAMTHGAVQIDAVRHLDRDDAGSFDASVRTEIDTRLASSPVSPVSTSPSSLTTSAPIRPAIQHLVETAVQLKSGQTEIALSPEELGRVAIRMTQTETGMLVVLTIERDDTQTLLRRHASDLADSLRAAGLGEAQIDFSDGRDDRGEPASGSAMPSGQIPTDAAAPEPQRIAPLATLGGLSDRIDIRL